MKAAIVFGLLLLAACAAPGERACTMEAKICPDGTAVGRTGPNCEFAPCPEPAQGARQYVSEDPEQCALIRYMCEQGTPFSDETGCGCLIGEQSPKLSGERFMLCERSEYAEPSFFEEMGFTCVDECPAGYDETISQIGWVCTPHYGEEEISLWATCEDRNDCASEQACALATHTTRGGEVADPRLRCVPNPYADYLTNTVGMTSVNEDGEQTTVIA